MLGEATRSIALVRGITACAHHALHEIDRHLALLRLLGAVADHRKLWVTRSRLEMSTAAAGETA